jgi:hypothetical protein
MNFWKQGGRKLFFSVLVSKKNEIFKSKGGVNSTFPINFRKQGGRYAPLAPPLFTLLSVFQSSLVDFSVNKDQRSEIYSTV